MSGSRNWSRPLYRRAPKYGLRKARVAKVIGVGDWLNVFRLPKESEQPEGEAEAIQKVRPDRGDGCELWRLRFVGSPCAHVERWVHPKHVFEKANYRD